MKFNRYGLIKIFEKAKEKFKEDIPCELDSLFHHPDRYRVTLVFAELRDDNILYCRVTGGQGDFPFPDNFCPEFWGDSPAVFLRYLKEDESPDDFQQDSFHPYRK